MGSNQMGQLGIGKHQIQALQPMLIREFDGKNINLIDAGQYHSAVYADGELYTWGWGIYGQLGHGNVFTEDQPKIVKFFSNKVEIRNLSLELHRIHTNSFGFPTECQTNRTGTCSHSSSMLQKVKSNYPLCIRM